MSDHLDDGVNKLDNSTDDVDPAAEFIAREQNVLAEIEQDDHRDENSSETSNNMYNNINSNSNSNLSNQINGDKQPFQEPEKIKKWREEQRAMLNAKDEEEAKRKKELAEQAKKEVEEWYTRYREQLNKSKQTNREACKNAEKEWIAERDAEAPGQEWERITRMCDFNPKSSRNSKDTSRMKSILLQLKQQPAP
ncbi:clathrin light chain isoform X1 [Brevipalpus obovatus]|uniref:clathrin light chain isoform X1 n=1 Tax=Brevipalpus obovatus TaxID=246614 RepID=UPI003D9DC8C6